MDIRSQFKTDYNIKGYTWIMHEHDVDHDPSVPHMHALEDNSLKMNIYTGDVYKYPKKKFCFKISKKQLRKLWMQTGFKELVIRERKRYEELEGMSGRKSPLPKMYITCKHNKVYSMVTNIRILNHVRNQIR